MRALRHSWYITLRNLRRFIRQPAWVAITLIQPMIWLLLFGALFKRVVEIPGYQGPSYIEYLTPGVIVMTAISSAGWNGMAFIDDMRSGVMDRLLVSPVWRSSLNVGNLVYAAVTTTLQSLIIVVVALLVGAHFPNGVGGIAILIVVACLLSAGVAALSNALALVVRQEETLIAGGDVDRVAADVPVLGFHAAEPRSELDPRGFALQPGQLGCPGQSFGVDRQDGLVADRKPDRIACGVAPDQLVPRDACVPRLPALALEN
jgi:ABC-type transport system involved in cytochrome c biogenesis permease component